MVTKINIPVSVDLVFDHKKVCVYPKAVCWNGGLYKITKVGLHHTYRQGRTLFHVFSVATNTTFFRLVLNTENLYWRLEEVSDGLPN